MADSWVPRRGLLVMTPSHLQPCEVRFSTLAAAKRSCSSAERARWCAGIVVDGGLGRRSRCGNGETLRYSQRTGAVWSIDGGDAYITSWLRLVNGTSLIERWRASSDATCEAELIKAATAGDTILRGTISVDEPAILAVHAGRRTRFQRYAPHLAQATDLRLPAPDSEIALSSVEPSAIRGEQPEDEQPEATGVEELPRLSLSSPQLMSSPQLEPRCLVGAMAGACRPVTNRSFSRSHHAYHAAHPPKICMGALIFEGPKTLQHTLQTWNASGIYQVARERAAFLQGPCHPVWTPWARSIVARHGFHILLGTKQLYHLAFVRLATWCTAQAVLLVEEDFAIPQGLVTKLALQQQLSAAATLLATRCVAAVRMRHARDMDGQQNCEPPKWDAKGPS